MLCCALWLGASACQTPRAAQVHHEGIRYGPWWEEPSAPDQPIAIGKPPVLPELPADPPPEAEDDDSDSAAPR